MSSYSLLHKGCLRGSPLWLRSTLSSDRVSKRSSARTSSTASSSTSSYLERVKGFKGPWKAALTSGFLSGLGDCLAQGLGAYWDQSNGRPGSYDPLRTARMFGFGLLFYGPYQYYWYNALDWAMPARNLVNFLSKVSANQLLLAPVTLTTVFCWNLALTGKEREIGDKLKNDLMPTLMNGWKFWVPAASVNFLLVPVRVQVLYMSICGILWTGYLSYASINSSVSAKAPLLVASRR